MLQLQNTMFRIQIIISMLLCEICNTNPQTALLTKCCKLFICESCKQKYQQIGSCVCSKPISKKLCSLNICLFEVLRNYSNGKAEECYRCSESASVECKECGMVFCKLCNIQIHSAIGFSKHRRQSILLNQQPLSMIDRMRKKQQWCKTHKLALDVICECGSVLCQGCLKIHKESCTKGCKVRGLKEYKEQYFGQILFKIKQITQLKEKLLEDKHSYESHFQKQAQIYKSCEKSVQEQIDGLKKILEIKSEEIKKRLGEYWSNCETIYRKNMYLIELNLKKFDDYARVSHRFIQQTIGLDYLQKRIKKVNVNVDFFSFKTINIEQIQASILNLSYISKTWEVSNQQNLLCNLENVESNNPKDKKLDLATIPASSQILLEITQNPLLHRPIALVPSHNSIQFDFLHLPYQNNQYEIQYGIGMKIKGQESFQRITNRNGKGLIEGLNPSTKYRVRMRVVGGNWGPVLESKTFDLQKFAIENCFFAKHLSENNIQLFKAGTIYGANQISFGIHIWQIKIMAAKNSYDQSERACISVGVSNKEQKKPVFVGETFNYGYQRSSISVKITLNCQNNRLIITNLSTNQDQVFQNLPSFPIYPAIQNKDNSIVQIQYNFL